MGGNTHSASQLCRLRLERQGADTIHQKLVEVGRLHSTEYSNSYSTVPSMTEADILWVVWLYRVVQLLSMCWAWTTEFLVLLNLCLGLDPECTAHLPVEHLVPVTSHCRLAQGVVVTEGNASQYLNIDYA